MLRATYLKTRYQFDFTYFISSLAGNYIIIFNLSSLVILICIAIIGTTIGYYSVAVITLFISLFLLTSYALLFAPKTSRYLPFAWLRAKVGVILEGWTIIRRSRKNILILYLLSSTNLCILSVITYFEFLALNIRSSSGEPVSVLQCLILTTMGSMALLISITPASLGIREGILMLSSELVRISPPSILAAAILDRAVSFIALLILANFGSYYLRTQLKSCQSVQLTSSEPGPSQRKPSDSD